MRGEELLEKYFNEDETKETKQDDVSVLVQALSDAIAKISEALEKASTIEINKDDTVEEEKVDEVEDVEEKKEDIEENSENKEDDL